MKIIVFLLIAICFTHGTVINEKYKKLVDSINKANLTWKAAYNSKTNFLFSLNYSSTEEMKFDYKNEPIYRDLPESFDVSEKCFNYIYDIGSCSSSWALIPASVASDRYCVHLGEKFQLSGEEVLSCCTSCGTCIYGSYLMAWNYMHYTGISTGGGFNQSDCCIPYYFPPCDHSPDNLKPCEEPKFTPKCNKKCQSSYKRDYMEDIHYIDVPYSLRKKNLETELYSKGPVCANIDIFEDFVVYKSGIYHHVYGSYLGRHPVKILGWGIDEKSGVRYWKIANSWNTEWGEKGFMRIDRNDVSIDVLDGKLSTTLPLF